MANPSTAAMIKAKIIREQLAKEKREKDSRNPNPKTPKMMGEDKKRKLTPEQIRRMRERADRGKVKPLKKGGLSEGQKKIASKAPPYNEIGGNDFAVLRKEKAKGRGMGLQDESVKPGKVMKAKYGAEIKPKGPGVLRPKPTGQGGKPLKPKPIKPNKKMGGGMMMKPMGYKSGTMVMARGCKLGRKKATRIT